jgi:hypothetical protein
MVAGRRARGAAASCRCERPSWPFHPDQWRAHLAAGRVLNKRQRRQPGKFRQISPKLRWLRSLLFLPIGAAAPGLKAHFVLILKVICRSRAGICSSKVILILLVIKTYKEKNYINLIN